ETEGQMEAAGASEERRRSVCILGSELVENYTVYVIQVTDGAHRWTVKHRYSDFHELHEKLSADWQVDKQLLPPKKMLGKNSPGLVERRRRELEVYLQTLFLRLLSSATPPPLASFLHFDLYERSGVAAALAEALFHRGEDLLAGGQVYCLRPLQLHSVWEQLHLSTPSGPELHTHLAHILDFTCRLRYLKIQGTQGPIGTSNIQESSLTFDLSIFKSLLHVSECSSQQIQGLPSLRRTLVTCSVHHTTPSMMAILAPEASEFPQWEAESAEGAGPGSHVTAVIPLWSKLTTLDLSHNTITEIDASVKLVPEVEFLDLSHNQLQSVDHLQYLYNLIHLDLSYNSLEVLQSAHTRLGNIQTLNLAGNRLETLSGLNKLYSLVNLDLSHNLIAQLQEVRSVAGLPCLERLSLTHNPLCCSPDYRTRTLALFWDRAAEVQPCLLTPYLLTPYLLTPYLLTPKSSNPTSSLHTYSCTTSSLPTSARPTSSLPTSSLFTSSLPTSSLPTSLHCIPYLLNPYLLKRYLLTPYLLIPDLLTPYLLPPHTLPPSSSHPSSSHSTSPTLSPSPLPSLRLSCSSPVFRCAWTARPPLTITEPLLPPTPLPASSELQRLTEENQPPAHLLAGLSPGQALLAGLPGPALQTLFKSCIAQWEGEEVRQVLWLSVIFYISPETEVTSCLLLSNKAIYFLLEDSASSLSLSSGEMRLSNWSKPHILSDLLSVNVGLFDQYFRLIGSACQVVCCVSRDSYGTSHFLKELMSALSLDRTRPDPEPVEQDFYTQFTSTTSGKMQNYELVHSSRVRFIYPNEDEMGDLTFIVADRKSPASSFNILLYLLVTGHAYQDHGSTPAPWLHPRTLVLTASHIFLLDEDYVSYPLPDFAKEPPCRERYQVREARRIRDVERVLLGYQTYPQALTLVLDELPGPDLLPPLHVDHFSRGEGPSPGGGAGGGAQEVTWCIFVPAADSRERLVALLARQWEALCSRELPLELTG
uniref:Nischarin n=1 Tax=Gadus morhua TaxID=8049 RepID=A0A8C5AML1_GADMO